MKWAGSTGGICDDTAESYLMKIKSIEDLHDHQRDDCQVSVPIVGLHSEAAIQLGHVKLVPPTETHVEEINAHMEQDLLERPDLTAQYQGLKAMLKRQSGLMYAVVSTCSYSNGAGAIAEFHVARELKLLTFLLYEINGPLGSVSAVAAVGDASSGSRLQFYKSTKFINYTVRFTTKRPLLSINREHLSRLFELGLERLYEMRICGELPPDSLWPTFFTAAEWFAMSSYSESDYLSYLYAYTAISTMIDDPDRPSDLATFPDAVKRICELKVDITPYPDNTTIIADKEDNPERTIVPSGRILESYSLEELKELRNRIVHSGQTRISSTAVSLIRYYAFRFLYSVFAMPDLIDSRSRFESYLRGSR
jgi:hypothetical protein